MTYVNEEAFFAWYESVTGKTRYNRSTLLDEVMQQYNRTGVEEFVVPAQKTLSGREERRKFRYDNPGCCGSSIPYLYF